MPYLRRTGLPIQRLALSRLHLLQCGPQILAKRPQLVLLGFAGLSSGGLRSARLATLSASGMPPIGSLASAESLSSCMKDPFRSFYPSTPDESVKGLSSARHGVDSAESIGGHATTIQPREFLAEPGGFGTFFRGRGWFASPVATTRPCPENSIERLFAHPQRRA
jgi:hypothetical protein